MEQDAFALLSRFLNEIGLGSLFSVDSQGNPGGWLWDQIVGGTDSQERLLMALEQTPEFRRRFDVIFELRNQAAAGENVVVPNVSQVLQYEQQYKTTMARAGVPSWFYDSYTDAHDALQKNLTIEQIAERIDSSFSVIQKLPTEVRDMFSEYFGDSSDASLVAAVLDPEKTLASLERATRTAVAGGFARRQGFDISLQQANEYASLGRNVAQTEAEMAQVGQLRDLSTASMGEAQLGAGEGLDVAFKAGALGQSDVQQQLESRLTTRRAGQGQSAGGALTLQEGIVGVGSAR
jgi:hypothetical protein